MRFEYGTPGGVSKRYELDVQEHPKNIADFHLVPTLPSRSCCGPLAGNLYIVVSPKPTILRANGLPSDGIYKASMVVGDQV